MSSLFAGYVKDRVSWILLFLVSLALTDALIWLDKGLSLSPASLLYLNGLLLILFAGFFAWRYRAETAYVRALRTIQENLTADWQESLPQPSFESERLVNEVLRDAADSNAAKLSDQRSLSMMEADYMASWVHEMKAPLTAMKLTIDAHRSDPRMRRLESDWLRLHLLLEQQLYMSRLPAMEADFVIERTSLAELAMEEVRELASWCLEKNIAVEIDGTGDALTDRKWSRFLIRQLLTNAVKYSPPDGMITIAVKPDTAGRMTMSVQDEGPGIPSHELPRIFDKGFTGGTGRLHNAATGLGLYLARRIAETMNIRIQAETEEGIGTRMVLVFPHENEFDMTRT